MKNNRNSSIESAMNKLEILSNESSKNVVGGGKCRIRISVRVVCD